MGRAGLTYRSDMLTDKVTVVIPNLNGADELEGCIASVLEETDPSRVIVVDDGSTDGSADLAEEAHPGIRVIRCGENLGFAHAVNLGIAAADTPYVFLLNNDTRVEKGAVRALCEAMEQGGDRVFSVGARMLTRRKPVRIDNCGDLYCILGWAFTPGRDGDPSWYTKRSRVTTACAGAALYRRDVAESLGLFDEAHFCYLEDVDLGIRARLRGYINLYEPAAVIYHTGSATSGSRHNAFKVKLTAGNNLYLQYKNFPAPVLVLCAPWFFTGMLIKAVYFARKGLFGAYMEGLSDGMDKIRENRGRKLSVSGGDIRIKELLVLLFEMHINLIRRISG